MKTSNNSYEPTFAVKGSPKIKTVRLQVGVTDLHLEARIKTTFALAKSAERELDLSFGIGHSSQNAFSQLRL